MIGLLLTLSFVVSLIALAFLIWAVATRQMAFDQRSASTIFVEGEEGHPDDAGVAPESDERVPHHFDTARAGIDSRSEEHTSELQSLMRISYAVFCLKKKKTKK